MKSSPKDWTSKESALVGLLIVLLVTVVLLTDAHAKDAVPAAEADTVGLLGKKAYVALECAHLAGYYNQAEAGRLAVYAFETWDQFKTEHKAALKRGVQKFPKLPVGISFIWNPPLGYEFIMGRLYQSTLDEVFDKMNAERQKDFSTCKGSSPCARKDEDIARHFYHEHRCDLIGR